MTITSIKTRQPVLGDITTQLDLKSPNRIYVAKSKTKDSEHDWVVVLTSRIRESARHDTSMEIEAKDLYEIASMLRSHAIALGMSPEQEGEKL